MMNFISTEMSTLLQNLNFNNTQSQNCTPNIPLNNNSPGPTNNSELDTLSSEKILNIIRNWRIKFTGVDNQITVDEFIYRVEILTNNNLRGNFDILCKHAHCLFEGKALEWYWRYHREINNINWFSLTTALRSQYKDEFTDYDILEDIRRRKQKQNENFDEYLDVILVMTNRLKTPMNDRDLCETILRNLKTELRHELLHLDITSVSKLRKEVKKHEIFFKDIQKHESRRLNKATLSEIVVEDEKIVTTEDEICSVQHKVTCWNCDKEGHTFFDCMSNRRIFCYGCGAKDIYKPNCSKCSKNLLGNKQKAVRRM